MAILEQLATSRNRAQPLVVKEQFEQWFESAADVMRALDIPVNWAVVDDNSRDSAQTRVGAELSFQRSHYMEMDYTLLTPAQHRKLHRHLTHSLPNFLRLYGNAIVKKGAGKAKSSHFLTLRWYALGLSFPQKIIQQESKLRKKQGQQELKQRYQSALAIAMNKSAVGPGKKPPEIKALPSPKASFAFVEQLKRFDAGLGEVAHALLRDWNAAYSKAAAVEHRYRLEQIVNEHLPELTRVLPGVSEASKPEAVALISEQLDMLYAQVRNILERHEVDAMDALRAQTSFIRELTSRARPSRLALIAEDAQEEQ